MVCEIFPKEILGDTPQRDIGRLLPKDDVLGGYYPTEKGDIGRYYPKRDLGRYFPNAILGMDTTKEILGYYPMRYFYDLLDQNLAAIVDLEEMVKV
ncbi:hypothetical protein Tco_0421776 [Tanacetum coccineum]